ncbi:MAG: response regulator [Anaerolinea sp.]|nr:response regulator [Anaerolinea sp.]MCC6976352.1 response regulator [Anaerolineae bacterium]CAG0954485.1 Transcriptional regulatory protein BaeR [Anaerolineae bacterium]
MAIILYVEDHPPAQLLMGAVVAEMTIHTLITAGNGEQARQAALQHRPALYIVDLDLPDTDGVSLIRQLKQIHSASAVLVSAYAESVDVERLSGIVDAYLAKPLDPTDVAQIIEHTLTGSN